MGIRGSSSALGMAKGKQLSVSMKKQVIWFQKGSSAAERKELIQAKIKELNCSNIIEGYLKKEGYDPIEYGYGDENLVFADEIEIHYEM